jgi:cysteine synthase B
MKRASHVFELIGKTPMVRINKMNPNPHVEIYAKLEGFNPMGSLKDRIALRMIGRAAEEGTLTKDKIILEATSGNTGISVHG